MRLILVRHAMPAYHRDVAPESWDLSGEGRAAAAQLVLPPDAYLVASAEPKAYQTLEPFGLVVRDVRFGEVRRRGEPWDGDYREQRRAYVEGVDHDEWEPRAEVVARFQAAIDDHSARCLRRPLVVGTHGMALTVWLTATAGLTRPGEFWEGLRFPDLIEVSGSS